MNVIYTIIASFTNGEIGIGENNVLTRECFELSNCPKRIASFQRNSKRDTSIFYYRVIYLIGSSIPDTFKQIAMEIAPFFKKSDKSSYQNEFILINVNLSNNVNMNFCFFVRISM